MMDKTASIKPFFKKLNFFLFSTLVFLVPIIFTYNTNELYEFPKMFFVYILGFTIITLFVVNRVLNAKPIKFPPMLVLFYVLGNILSAIFSKYLYTAVWGYYTRFNGGLISAFIFFGLFIVAINEFKKEDLENLFKIFLVTLVPISMYGIFQHFGLFGVDSNVRVYSTFGQPNWLASYIGMLLPLTFYYYLKEDLELFWFVVFVLGFSSMWFTYSMSGLLGFILGIIVLIALNLKIVAKEKKKVLVLFATTIIIAATNLGVFQQRLKDVFTDIKRDIGSRIIVYAQEPSYNLSDTGFIRIGLWRATLNMIFSSPKNVLLGVGPEAFPYEFQPFRNRELNYSSEWNFVFNNAHNYYLEIWANLGLVGLVPYLGILFFSIKRRHYLITPVLVSLYVSNLFSWLTVSTALLFWLLLAYLELDKK